MAAWVSPRLIALVEIPAITNTVVLVTLVPGMRPRIRWDGVVGGNTAKWSALSEKTSTPASARITIDGSAGKVRPATKIGPPAKSGAS